MNILEGIKRLENTIKNESDPDYVRVAKAVLAGMTNFHFGKNTKLAEKRFKDHCSGCELNILEPVEDMRVIDKLIPQLSNRMCDNCGCVLSFKIRQSVKKCEKWKL